MAAARTPRRRHRGRAAHHARRAGLRCLTEQPTAADAATPLPLPLLLPLTGAGGAAAAAAPLGGLSARPRAAPAEVLGCNGVACAPPSSITCLHAGEICLCAIHLTSKLYSCKPASSTGLPNMKAGVNYAHSAQPGGDGRDTGLQAPGRPDAAREPGALRSWQEAAEAVQQVLEALLTQHAHDAVYEAVRVLLALEGLQETGDGGETPRWERRPQLLNVLLV